MPTDAAKVAEAVDSSIYAHVRRRSCLGMHALLVACADSLHAIKLGVPSVILSTASTLFCCIRSRAGDTRRSDHLGHPADGQLSSHLSSAFHVDFIDAFVSVCHAATFYRRVAPKLASRGAHARRSSGYCVSWRTEACLFSPGSVYMISLAIFLLCCEDVCDTPCSCSISRYFPCLCLFGAPACQSRETL